MEKQIIQITSGRGPAECQWVVARVLKKLVEEAGKMGFRHRVLSRQSGTENGVLASAELLVEGRGVGDFVKSWTGVVQWIGQSPFRKYHKRKNWYVGVNALRQAAETKLQESDVKYQAVRSGGPGGQHVNKVSTAIRATHHPTGLTVLASDTRSQGQNKKLARERLEKLVAERALERRTALEQANWQNHNELERGNPIRIYTGRKFQRK